MQEMPPTELQERSVKVLSTLTPDASGNYSGDQLAGLVANPQFKGNDAVAAAALYSLYFSLTDPNKGSSDFQLNQKVITDMRPPAVHQSEDMTDLFFLSDPLTFKKVDKNQDGKVSVDELTSSTDVQRMASELPAVLDQARARGGLAPADADLLFTTLSAEESIYQTWHDGAKFAAKHLSRSVDEHLFARPDLQHCLEH